MTISRELLASSSRRLALLGTIGLLPALVLAQAPTITGFTPTVGPSGTSVVISGTNLSATTTTVMLNGQAVPVTLKTGTALTVRIPAAASSGKLRVTTYTGTTLKGTALSAARFLVSRSSSAGSTGTTTMVAGITAAGGYSTPYATDLDNDGLIDLLMGDANGNITAYEQTVANGAFATTGTVLTAGGAAIKVTNYAKPAVTDLDGNGLLDLIVGTGTGRQLLRYEQTAIGAYTFTAKGALTANTATAPGTFAAIGTADFPRPSFTDLDGNGLLDMLVGDNDGTIVRYEQTAVNAATFTPKGNLMGKASATATTFSTIDVGTVSKPQVIDFDGDGLLDLLIGNYNGNIVRYEQTAVNSTTFILIGNLADSNGTIDVGTYAAPTITDIDGDGQLDVLMGSATGDLRRYEQAAAAPLSPLPVELTSFIAKAAATGIQLNWATAQEKNSARFVVERSMDGKTFTAIAEQAAAGTTSAPSSYRYLDASAAALQAGTRYYRLRQEDLDGTTSYSPVASVSRSASALASSKLEVYPNPFASELNVALPAGSELQAAKVELLSLTGQMVFSSQLALGAAPQALALPASLAPGSYVLRVSTAASTLTQRVSKR
ncbi:FG-GAP-like repeat-containing protein [Hymenobacter sp. ASUV-10]|uniref:FG-GAP-like repeat-containing protein n=1 Tax=Hymenobacter aranciens TaxID=3063996 RepID=A0ABT9BHI6_9BACT|nr:FG-GAP-like repeat-containing protein [Hymenobacter sp. ASUV-10]MDO7877133.1 FG-GAP-like repeat-containing protein [Hymenobacter sp. ASUV-10]